MEATDVLSAEHQVILRVITALEKMTDQLEQGRPVRPAFFLEAAAFIKGFADGCHHRKEEGVLFTAMAEHGLPVQDGPIGVMLAEHEQGREFTRGMRRAAEQLEAQTPGAPRDLARNARGYITLLRQHIMKEDNILFPMANQVIPVEAHGSVLAAFDKVEHEETGEGVHEKFLALAEKLEAEASQLEQ